MPAQQASFRRSASIRTASASESASSEPIRIHGDPSGHRERLAATMAVWGLQSHCWYIVLKNGSGPPKGLKNGVPLKRIRARPDASAALGRSGRPSRGPSRGLGAARALGGPFTRRAPAPKRPFRVASPSQGIRPLPRWPRQPRQPSRETPKTGVFGRKNTVCGAEPGNWEVVRGFRSLRDPRWGPGVGCCTEEAQRTRRGDVGR